MLNKPISLGAGTLTATDIETGKVVCTCRTEGMTFTPAKEEPKPKIRIHTEESIAMGRAFLGKRFKGEIGEEYE